MSDSCEDGRVKFERGRGAATAPAAAPQAAPPDCDMQAHPWRFISRARVKDFNFTGTDL